MQIRFFFDEKDIKLVDYLDCHQGDTAMAMHHSAHPGEGLAKYLPENLSVTDAVVAILKARL